MPVILFAALAGSLSVHLVALFGVDHGLFGEPPERPPLQAELRAPPPLPTPPAPAASSPAAAKPLKPKPEKLVAAKAAAPVVEAVTEIGEKTVSTATEPEPAPLPLAPAAADAVLKGSGRLAFVVVKESLGMQIGRAVHRWEFGADGSYRLTSMIETSGLAALIRPLRQQYESRGRLGPRGLQPDSYQTWRNGKANGENADFDWLTAEVRLQRDGSVQRITSGTQDLLSLNYQLAYLPAPENGSTIGVVTGRKYEHYNLDSLGEEEIDTPAGRFRTLHLRAAGETLTEIWIALDHQRLPVKIRFTDKKGESYQQLATEIDVMPVASD